jgi:DNA polymerase-3 subunit beta
MESKTEFKVTVGALLGALQKASGVSGKPFILFEIRGGSLTVSGSNYETQIEASVDLIESSSDTSFCVDGSVLSLIKLLPEQPLAVTVTEEAGDKITRIYIEITHSGGRAKFAAFMASEYAKMHRGEGDTFTVPAWKLKRGIDKTIKFVGTDELRPTQMSVYMDIVQDGIVFAGTDGHILSRFKDKSLAGVPANSMMIHTSAASSISSLIGKSSSGEATISVGAKSISVNLGDAVVTSRVIEGKYPNYNAVIPMDNPIRLTTDSKGLSNAIRRLLISSEPIYNTVEIVAKGDEVRLLSNHGELGKRSEERIPALCEGGIEIKFSIPILDVAMGMMNGNATLLFSGSTRPALIVPETDEDDTELTTLVCSMRDE